MKVTKSTNFVMIGPPGSGKGTQREKLARFFRLRPFVMGDVLRKIAQRDTPLGKEVKPALDKGTLVPDELTLSVVLDYLGSIPKDQGVVFDGWPRTIRQYLDLVKLSRSQGSTQPYAVYLKVSEKTITFRLLSRRICEECQEAYFPPKSLKLAKCEKCGGKMIRRSDDNTTSIKRRIEIYHQETDEVIKRFRQDGRLIEVDGEPSIEKVWQNVRQAIKKFTD